MLSSNDNYVFPVYDERDIDQDKFFRLIDLDYVTYEQIELLLSLDDQVSFAEDHSRCGFKMKLVLKKAQLTRCTYERMLDGNLNNVTDRLVDVIVGYTGFDFRDNTEIIRIFDKGIDIPSIYSLDHGMFVKYDRLFDAYNNCIVYYALLRKLIIVDVDGIKFIYDLDGYNVGEDVALNTYLDNWRNNYALQGEVDVAKIISDVIKFDDTFDKEIELCRMPNVPKDVESVIQSYLTVKINGVELPVDSINAEGGNFISVKDIMSLYLSYCTDGSPVQNHPSFGPFLLTEDPSQSVTLDVCSKCLSGTGFNPWRSELFNVCDEFDADVTVPGFSLNISDALAYLMLERSIRNRNFESVYGFKWLFYGTCHIPHMSYDEVNEFFEKVRVTCEMPVISMSRFFTEISQDSY